MELILDVNTWRIAVTVLSFVAFVGIVVWAWSSQNVAAFAEAARLPLRDGEGSRP